MAHIVIVPENVKPISQPTPQGATVQLDWESYKAWFESKKRDRRHFFEKSDTFESVHAQAGYHLIRGTHRNGEKVLAWVPEQFVTI